MSEPFFIVPKAPFSEITRRVEGTDGAYCVAVYTALRRLANDEHSANGPVQLSIAQVASAAGLSYNTADRILSLLQSISMIGIAPRFVAGTKSRAPSVYTFPALGGTTFPAMEGTFPTEPPLLRAEIIKNGKERKEYGAAADASAGKRPGKSPKPRMRNPLLDALATLDGSDLAQVTGSAWGACAKALKEICEVSPDVTSDEIRRRADAYRTIMPEGCKLTATALAKHWGKCAAQVRTSEPPMRRISAA